MGRTLDVGRVQLLRVAGGDEITSVQIASGMGPDGELVVLLRVGPLVAALEPDAAAEVGRAMIAEAELVRMGGPGS